MKKKKIVKKLKGKVVSNSGEKTVSVLVESIKRHPKYFKKYKSSKKYLSHLEKGKVEIGDSVLIEATRPISKRKKWKVVQKS